MNKGDKQLATFGGLFVVAVYLFNAFVYTFPEGMLDSVFSLV